MNTLDTIKQRGAQDKAAGIAWEFRPKYTSLTAQFAYMEGYDHYIETTADAAMDAQTDDWNARMMGQTS